MLAFDGVEFLQSLLTSIFLTCLFFLIPRLLAAVSMLIEPQSPHIASYIENLYRHNPMQQWGAERTLAAEVARCRYRLIDLRNGVFLNPKDTRTLICPSRKWLAVSVVYLLISITATVLGALTIMWQESISVNYEHGQVTYPAWPADIGLNKMNLRGNCQWIKVSGSGDIDKTGFAIYQMCADVFRWDEKAELRVNEVRAKHNNTFYKLVFSLETLTQNGIDEYWKVSAGNEPRLADVREARDYLEDCDAECQGQLRDKGLEHVIIQQALREVGMVPRKVEHYKEAKEFKLENVLKERRGRLKREAWITMLFVSITAILWMLVGLIRMEGETDFGIVTRMLRASAKYGPETIASVLEPTVGNKPSFVLGKHKLDALTLVKLKEMKESQCKKPSDDGMTKKPSWRGSDVLYDASETEEAGGVFLQVADYVYDIENAQRARKGMLIIANRAEDYDLSPPDNFATGPSARSFDIVSL